MDEHAKDKASPKTGIVSIAYIGMTFVARLNVSANATIPKQINVHT